MSAMNLEQLQRTMLSAVMQPLTADEQMQQHNASGLPMSEVASSFIAPNSRLTAFERLEIYNRQYWFRIQSAFWEDFPGLRSVVRPARFESLMNAYLAANPSRSFTLRNLGAKFVDWLAANPGYAGRRIALALDVARIEWACVEAFDNVEHPPLTLEEIAILSAESHLALQPYIQLLALEYPADDLVIEMHRRERREASEAGTRSEEAEHEEQSPASSLHLRKRPIWLAIHRADDSLYYKRLTRPEYRTLIALRDGLTLSESLEAAFEGTRISAARRIASVQEWFTHWAGLGWLVNPALISMQ